ncbi:ribonuclease HII [bacterium]|nr:ribonuclease HII [bacterium]
MRKSGLDLRFERACWSEGKRIVAGVDEAGRGPLAGPVVAAAVIMPRTAMIRGIQDSKLLSVRRREVLFQQIQKEAQAIGIGIVSEKEIDRINILQASLKAMAIAVGRLDVQPDQVLVDGLFVPEIPCGARAIVRGDRSCYSIATASIVAKVTRDRIMVEYDRLYPQYGFARHKGYPTFQHRMAIRLYGPCEIHRKTFHAARDS